MNNKIILVALFLLGLSPAAATYAAGQARPAQYKVPPQVNYPYEAKQQGLEGEVRVEVKVLADGSVADARVIKSSGTALLDEEALRSVRAATFKPALSESGKEIESICNASIRFFADAPVSGEPPSQVVRIAPGATVPEPPIDADLQRRRVAAAGTRIGRHEAAQLQLLTASPPRPFPPYPAYPMNAKHEGRQGQVRLGVEVDLSGTISTVQVLTSSGSGDLDAAAQTAIWNMRLTQEQIRMIENELGRTSTSPIDSNPFKGVEPVLNDKQERAGYRFISTINFKLS